MIRAFKFGLFGGFAFLFAGMVLFFLILLPLSYTFDMIEKYKTWSLFYENWHWSNLFDYERWFFFKLRTWRILLYFFIMGFGTYFILAIKVRKYDFSE